MSSDKIEVTDNKTCYSYYNPKTKTIHTTFKGIVDLSLMKEHIANVRRLSKEDKVLGTVVDFRQLRGSFVKLIEHLGKEVQPELQARGFNTKAFVITDDLIINNLTQKLTDTFRQQKANVRVFNDIDIANEWLLKTISA
ncbi:MAG: hypothetical protein ABFS32_07535 [Bacteroidota bacterium]